MKKLYVVAIALLIGVISFTQPTWGNDKVTELLQHADEYIRAGNASSAYPLLQQALELDPEHEQTLYRLCLFYVTQKRFEEAQRNCQVLVNKYPGKELYRFNLYLSRTKTIMPKVVQCVSQGDFSCAIQLAQNLLETDRNAPQGHSLIGLLYMQRDTDHQDRSRAVAHFREAIRLQESLPSDSPFVSDLAGDYAGLGITYVHAEDYGRAIESLEKALELDPSIPDVRENLEIARRRSAEGRQSKVVWLSLADILGID